MHSAKLRALFHISSFTFSGIIFLLASTVILILSYFILWPNFTADAPVGTDAMSAYMYVEHLNKYFPSVPFWYPNQGGGVSFTSGYPYFAHYLVVLIHKLTSIPLIRAFNILEFSVFPVSALSILVFALFRLNYPKQKPARLAIGLVAAAIYLTSPITYIWAQQWGFYAETVSYLFIGPAIIAFDYFLEKAFQKDFGWRTRIVFVIAQLLYYLTFLTHFSSGMGLTHFILLIIFLRTAVLIKKHKTKIFRIATITLLITILPLIGLFAWRYSAYRSYNTEVAKGGFSGYVTDPWVKMNKQNLPTFKQVFGWEKFEESDPRYVINNWSVPPYTVLLLFFGLIAGWIRSKRIFMFSAFSFFALCAYPSIPIIRFTLLLGTFGELLNNRSIWTVYRIITPIAAAAGAYLAWDLSLAGLDYLVRKTNTNLEKIYSSLFKPTVVLLLIAVMCTIIIQTTILPTKIDSLQDQRLMQLGLRTIDLNNIWRPYTKQSLVEQQKFTTENIQKSQYFNRMYLFEECARIKNGEYTPTQKLTELNICHNILNKIQIEENTLKQAINLCESIPRSKWKKEYQPCTAFHLSTAYQLNPQNWPKINPYKPQDELVSREEKELFSHIPNTPLQTRFDLSALSASTIMRAPLITDVSQTQVYINSLSLWSALWNYQSSVMYSQQPLYQKEGILSEIAKYYGYEHVLATNNSATPTYLYQKDSNWTKLDKSDWWQFTQPTGLVTWTDKPSVLVIGDEKKFQYDQIFRVINQGIIPYDEAIVFGGDEHVDKYSLSQLQKFDAIILQGYKYSDTEKGHQLLTDYVDRGGSIFIDTGWQYTAPDWQISSAPPFFPTNTLEWKEISASSDITLDNKEFLNIQTENPTLGYLTTPGGKWGVSAPVDIRKDSYVIMQSKDTPLLIARTYGKGKVIWSGYNAIAHTEGTKFENSGVVQTLNSAFKWLLDNSSNEKTYKNLETSLTRNEPDSLSVTFKESQNKASILYFRESYYPKWKAQLISTDHKTQSVDVFRAGPRFMGIKLPPIKENQKLVLTIKPTLNENLLLLLSYSVLIYLLLYIFGITKPIERYLKFSTFRVRKKIKDTHDQMENFKIHEDPDGKI